jgi:hypothetical protein
MKGAEWELFREGLSALWDWVEASFDLQPSQKLAMLALVGQAMRDDTPLLN